MISIDVTILIQMVNFLVFLVLMNLTLYRPIRSILARRQQVIEERQAVIDGMNAEVAESIKDYDLKLQDARQSGRAGIQDMKSAAYEQEKELLEGAARDVSKRLHDIRSRVRDEVGMARSQLSEQVQAFSVELTQKILGRNI